MRQGNALPFVAALAVLSAASTLHAQCTPTVVTVSQPGAFPNHTAGPIATNGTVVAVAKNDLTTTTPAIYVGKYDANLNPVGADVKVAASSLNGATAFFYADDANEYGLFYQRADATLLLQRVDVNGNAISTPVAMPHSWSPNDEFDVTWDHAAGNYVLAHLVTGGPDLGLWLEMISPAGKTISDLNVSPFAARGSNNTRVTALPDGSVAVSWTSSRQATFVTIVRSSSMLPIEITEQAVTSTRIASNGTSVLAIYSAPRTGGGTQMRFTVINATTGATSTPDALYLNATGVDIAPLSLQWFAATSEFVLVYANSIAGFNVFPGEVHLRRFAAPTAPSSDTFLSPNVNLNLLNAPYPLLFLNGGYIGSISRFVSIAQGGESYLVRDCPLLTSFTADHPVSRSFSPITFRASASGGNPGYTFSWAFGDNASATGPVVQHMYSANGTYTVTLTAMDAAGATSIFKSTVLITDQVRGRAVRH
jgi:hypothetical protein